MVPVPPTRRIRTTLIAALVLVFSSFKVSAADRFITVASTTSTRNSGLYDHILPLFTEATGVTIRVVAVGTGQAIRLAKAGDADVLFVHHRPSEEAFVRNGFGVKRYDVMYNDFVIVGPKADPAGAAKQNSAAAALTAIAKANWPFTSRGDDSGTHKKEMGLWRAAGVNTAKSAGEWYRETGAGMGATLNTASAMNAYALTDRATWLKFANKGELTIVNEGDKRLFNPYGVVLVDPKKHPHTKVKNGQAFINWLISDAGQRAIAAYDINGQQAFFPNVKAAN